MALRKVLDVVADRFRIDGVEKARVLEAIETCPQAWQRATQCLCAEMRLVAP